MPDEVMPLIRVKSFANIEIENDIPQNDENGHDNNESMDIISISSEEEKEPVIKGRRRKKEPKTPKPKKEKVPRLPSSAGYNRRFRTPLTQKYHKISEYFSSTKKDYKMEPTQVKPLSLNMLLENEANDIKQKPTEKTEIERLLSDKRKAVVLLRRLSIDKKVETKRTRDKHEDQSKLPDFIRFEPVGDSYYKTHQKSTLPEGAMVRINSALLKDDISIDGNFVRYKQTKSHNMITVDNNDLLFPLDDTTSKGGINNNNCDGSNEENIQDDCLHMTAKKTISRKKSKIPPKSKISVIMNKSISETPKSNSKQICKQKKVIECPYYKIIEGTKFAVDAFRYGDIDGVDHYFLSHFHADHYIGLKKSFNHTLYVSNITGRLVQEFIKVDAKYIKCLDINTPIVVDGVEVTAVDANHCPGAVMFIFKLTSGKCILHTGDFRASPEMEEYAEFWNNDIHTIYLDTTYLTSRYEFRTQSDSINELIMQCHAFVDASVSSSGKPLIICGAYKVGKEKVWLRVAQEFDYKVWIDDERRKAMECIKNEDILGALTRYAKDANIHVLPLGNVSYQHIVNYVGQFGETFCKVLAIRPSGWEKNAAKPSFKNRISMLGIQYSEHSNYNELERFVRFLRPEKVISTVPLSNKNVTKTPNIPKSWLNKKLKPKSNGQQLNIKDFLVQAGQSECKQVEKQQRPSPPDSNQAKKIEEQFISENKSSNDVTL